MSILITIIITYYLLIIIIVIIITKYHNNYCSIGFMELCVLNLLISIDCFCCNSYPCVLFEGLSHVINEESHVYSENSGKIYLIHFLKFIQNFPLKHVIKPVLIGSNIPVVLAVLRKTEIHYRK